MSPTWKYVNAIVIFPIFMMLDGLKMTTITLNMLPYFVSACGPTRAMAASFTRFLDHTQRRTTVGRAPLDEWSARRRSLYLTTHNTHNRQTSMPQWDSNPQSQQASGRRPTS